MGLARVEEFVNNVAIVRNVLEGERRRRTIEILKLRGSTHMKSILSRLQMMGLTFSPRTCD